MKDASTRSSFAVIGAGLSGLRAANILSDQGHQVNIFEKSSRPGGRLGALEWDGTPVDAGAQYFTVRDALFRRHVTSWIQEGIVAPWDPVLAVVDAPGSFRRIDNSLDRYVGVPGMLRLAQHLSTHMDIRFDCRVEKITYHDEKWTLTHTNGSQHGAFDAIIIATPASQAITLLPADSELVPVASRVRMAPCQAVMAVFHKPLALPYDALFFNNAPLSWAARNSSKPDRSPVEIWVLHAAHDWTRDNDGANPRHIAERLLEIFFQWTATSPVHPRAVKTRLWPFAAATPPLDEACLWSAAEGIGICGDWCAKSRIEGAFLSGTAVAGRVLKKAVIQASKNRVPVRD